MLTIKQAKKRLARFKKLMPSYWIIMLPEVAIESIRRREGPIFFSFSRQGEIMIGAVPAERLLHITALRSTPHGER